MKQFRNLFSLVALVLLTATFSFAQNVPCYFPQGGASFVAGSGCTIDIQSGATVQRTEQIIVSAGGGVIGATAGWAIPSAHSGFTNAGIAGLPASSTASTLVIPVEGLKVGDIITAFSVVGQIESAGGGVTLDAALRKLTVAAGDTTDASLGAITQVSVTADEAVEDSKTLATPETVAANEQFYVLITGTTAASTDIQLSGVTLTVTRQ